MLFLLNTPDAGRLARAGLLAGDDDKDLLLISDAVFLARSNNWDIVSDFGFDGVYADAKAVDDRGLEIADGCQVTDMAALVKLVVDHRRIVNL